MEEGSLDKNGVTEEDCNGKVGGKVTEWCKLLRAARMSYRNEEKGREDGVGRKKPNGLFWGFLDFACEKLCGSL